MSFRLPLILVLVLLTAVATAQDSRSQEPPPQKVAVRTSVGMEGQFLLRHTNDTLRARPLTKKSPVVLRIVEVTRDGKSFLYDLRFIGEVAGRYDLRQWLSRLDGKAPQGVEPILVQVSSVLPAAHKGEIHELGLPPPPALGGYRLLLWGFAILWSVPLVWFILRRLFRARGKVADGEVSGPTLADQLRPLIEAALRGELSTGERARLELLLLAYWRERLGLVHLEFLEALRQMRSDAEGGHLLRSLEDWLHRRPGTVSVDVDRLLEPYRRIAAIDLPDSLRELEVPA